MRGINPFRRMPVEEGHDGAPPTKEAITKSFVRQVWDAPATHNRATRRAARLWGRIWKWDVNTPGFQRTFVPRYIRRHYSRKSAVTRRQRRHYNRVMRIAAHYGIGL
jgi:hypothetical protein